MCLKVHKYYVCPCRNPACTENSSPCCLYSPDPLTLGQTPGHLAPTCKSEERRCAVMEKQVDSYAPSICKDARVRSELKNIAGLCWECQVNCLDKQQTGGGLGQEAQRTRRKADSKQWKVEMEKWTQDDASDSDDAVSAPRSITKRTTSF